MNKKECPVCGSKKTIKNGVRSGRQLYRCTSCGCQFRASNQVSGEELWRQYQEGKQTIRELSLRYDISESTVKRRMRSVAKEWIQPPLGGRSGFVHIDVTYWGRNWGVLLAMDSRTGFPLYLRFVAHETAGDYVEAVRSISDRGYEIHGLIVDGNRHLFRELSQYRIQMCQAHMERIVFRYLPGRTRMHVSRELRDLVGGLTHYGRDEFVRLFESWKARPGMTLSAASRYRQERASSTTPTGVCALRC